MRQFVYSRNKSLEQLNCLPRWWDNKTNNELVKTQSEKLLTYNKYMEKTCHSVDVWQLINKKLQHFLW